MCVIHLSSLALLYELERVSKVAEAAWRRKVNQVRLVCGDKGSDLCNGQ